MFRHLTDLTKAAIFYGLTFTLVLSVALLSRGGGSDLAQILSMLTPTVALLLMLLVVTRDSRERSAWRSLGLGKAGLRLWPAAFLLPVLVLSVAYVILWGTGYATAAMPADRSLPDLAIKTVMNFVVIFVFALAEEIGWRGYLLPHLLSLGARRAALLTGLLHGLFHLPLLLLTPFYHSDGNRLIVIPLFLLSLTMAGAIYGYLRLTTASVWPSAIAHTTLNTAWNLLSTLTVASSPLAAEYLAGESGLLPLVGYTLMAGWCLYRLGGRRRRAAERAASGMPATAARLS